MDLHALLLLVEIIDAGNLSEAARRLKMSRANVSYRLHQFEKEIGQQLLRRTTRRIEPTEIGYRLYEHGMAIRNEQSAAVESVATLGQGPQGRLRLSVPSAYGQVVMSHWLIEFKRMYPGIVRDVACASSEYARSHDLPTTLEQLRALPLITSEVIGRKLRLTAYLEEERHEVMLEPGMISENMLFLRQAILAGLGIGIVPDYLIRDDLQRGDGVTMLDEWRLSIFGTRMYLLYR